MNEKFNEWMVKEGFGYWIGDEERTRHLYEIRQRYLKLQRRTILYGLLSMVTSAYLSAWVVLQLGLSVTLGASVGLLVGIVLTTATVGIVRWTNPQ